jgi:NAD(P)-dependent dehydrogenase (short-subunit alcohol dehydrogenase family)
MEDEREVVWITGGGTGIGRALARKYASRGAAVAVSGRRVEKLEEAVADIDERGGRGLAVQCDVTEEQKVEEAVAEVVETFGHLDVAIANAGMAVSGPVCELDADDWRRQLDVNVVGVAMTARHSVPHLEETQGRLGLMGSVAGTVTLPGEGAYAASKYAVRAMGQSLSHELRGTGVSCTTIQPGFVESDIVKRDNEDEVHDEWEDRRPQMLTWPVDRAARVIVRAMDRRKREYTFTAHGRVASWFGRHAPWLVHHAVKWFG